MEIRTILHEEYQEDYRNGIEVKEKEIKSMGFEEARNKFNMDNPVGQKPTTLRAYYFAAGELDALVKSL